MKTRFKFLFAVACMSLLFACNKSELVTEDLSGVDLKSASIKHGEVFLVTPNGVDDTQALIDAFNLARAAGRGSIVQLTEGQFTIGMIEIRDFYGYFLGAGIDKTTVTNLSDITPDGLVALNKLPALITFIGGDITASDLSVKLSEGLSWLGTQEMNMLLFSDYSADFMPAKQHIGVNLSNVEVDGVLQKNVELWPDGPILDFPYANICGVKFAYDILAPLPNTLITRSNIDASVSNCKFSNFQKGTFVWGCKQGNFNFGTEGGNIYTGNNQGLCINENIGLNVKIENNKFTITDYKWNGIDLNTGAAAFGTDPFEKVQGEVGVYEIRNNIFDIYIYGSGFGVMDAWRYTHPDNPSWMKIICDNNTFNALGEGAVVGQNYSMKNALFSKNTIAGSALNGFWPNTGLYWIGPDDPNYLLTWSEGCKFLNNKFLQKDMVFFADMDTKDFLVMGDLSNVIVQDNGVNNKFIGKTNPGHSNLKSAVNPMSRLERIRKMHSNQFGQ